MELIAIDNWILVIPFCYILCTIYFVFMCTYEKHTYSLSFIHDICRSSIHDFRYLWAICLPIKIHVHNGILYGSYRVSQNDTRIEGFHTSIEVFQPYILE